MDKLKASAVMADFVDRAGTVGLFSTGATTINYSGVLYNVDGSSPDPQIDGKNWKQLLKSFDIDESCYVTNSTPDGNSHPGFDVGGHMTPNSNGEVADGADTYLMPLCKWHNNSARNGVAFAHTNTLMLLLSGYMQSELAVSFMARLPSEERFAVVYDAGDEWKNANLTDDEASELEADRLSDDVLSCCLDKFVLLERVEREQEYRYLVKKSNVVK